MPTRSSPDLAQAVVLAEVMVASGCDDPATIEVAALPRSVIRSDGEPLVREMLLQHGIALPPAGDEEGEYEFLLHAFGFSDLPVSDLASHFWHRLPGVDDQSDLQRTLACLLADVDHASLADRERAIERMREAVRRAEAELPSSRTGRREMLDELTEHGARDGLYDAVPDYTEALKDQRATPSRYSLGPVMASHRTDSLTPVSPWPQQGGQQSGRRPAGPGQR